MTGGAGTSPLRPPERLTTAHDTAAFDCGNEPLNTWLRQRALQNEESRVSRTYVVCKGNSVVAYYSLANGAVCHREAIGKVRRNAPDPVPVMVIGRLAVDHRYHGLGIGRGLLRDAILRTLQAAEIAGIRAILVHAKHERAAAFYASSGFSRSPTAPLTMMVTLLDAAAALALPQHK